MHELDEIRPGRDICKPEHAVGIRGRRADHRTQIVLQIDSDIRNARLQRVLHSVRIQIVPDEVANCCPSRIARIDRVVDLAVEQRDDLREPRAHVCVRVGGIWSDVRCRARITKRREKRDDVQARIEVCKAVGTIIETVVDGNLGVKRVVKREEHPVHSGTGQLDVYTVEPRLGHVLLAVAVTIDPYEAFQRRRQQHA